MKLSQGDRKDIVAALQSGNATTTDLSRKYNVTRDYITAISRKDTGTKLKPYKRLSQTEKETILVELKTNKTPLNKLAVQYGVTPPQISYLYKKSMGRPVRPFPIWKLSDQEKEMIVSELLAKKATIGELAKRFDVPRGTISKIFRNQTGKNVGTSPVPGKVKAALIEEIRTKKQVTKRELAEKYKIHPGTLERILKQETGKTFTLLHSHQSLPIPLATYLDGNPRRRHLPYRGWQKEEKQMYPVLGIDWYHRKVLIPHEQGPVWHPMQHFTLMLYSQFRDQTRTPEYPKGKGLCEGDIVQFPILLQGSNGARQKTIVKATVTFDRELGMFILPEVDDDPLALHDEEGEIIGTIYENPDLIPVPDTGNAAGEST
jgi:transposase-like protein